MFQAQWCIFHREKAIGTRQPMQLKVSRWYTVMLILLIEQI